MAIDAKAFGKLRRIAPNLLEARRQPEDWQPRELPEEVCFKLTNRCDLRCIHCYHWGQNGYHRRLPVVATRSDLPLEILAKVLEATRALRSNVFLSGGEPLLYDDWDGLVNLLVADPRWTSICTNGSHVEQRLDSLLRISAQLELSVSLDGLEPEHDALRGSGAFARTLAGIVALVRCKRAGTYLGEISVNCVIGDLLVGRLREFIEAVEAEGVETLYLSLPWYISEETSREMEGYLAQSFPELAPTGPPSWRSFGYRIASHHAGRLRDELARVAEQKWRLKLRFNPKVPPNQLLGFLSGSSSPVQDRTRCLALRTRLDVFPNGDVVACKFFPEFTMGNLKSATLAEVWNGELFRGMRETVARTGVMPVCAKCNLLYARGG